MCDGGHGRRGGERGERAKSVTCVTGMRAITMGHLLESLSTTTRNHHPSSTMLTSKKSSPSSGIVQGKLVESKSHTLSFGDGEKVENTDDSKVAILWRGELTAGKDGKRAAHEGHGWEHQATINCRGYGAVGEGLAAKRNLIAEGYGGGREVVTWDAWLRVIGWWRRDQHLKGCEVFAVTEGHNDSGGPPSHGRENGGVGCALRPKHRKMVRLLGRRCSGATERRSKNG
ncbi:class I glutamine amidotransferase-like protein [Sesbania bispinosa]|nr:class I glutamine amidotransferase-like protein [Sesbania bispinosa]